MPESTRRDSTPARWLGLASFGLFVLLLGTIWLLTPNMSDETIMFGRDITSHFENITGNIILPAPQDSHPVVYTAAMQFCFIFGIFQVAIVAIRIYLRDIVNRIADTSAGIAFWFGTGYFLYLLVNEATAWFGFLAGIIVSGGIAIIVSSIIKFFR